MTDLPNRATLRCSASVVLVGSLWWAWPWPMVVPTGGAFAVGALLEQVGWSRVGIGVLAVVAWWVVAVRLLRRSAVLPSARHARAVVGAPVDQDVPPVPLGGSADSIGSTGRTAI